MRELTEKEKELNNKSINRFDKELEIWELSKQILETELAQIPIKLKIAEYTKSEELDKTKQRILFLQSQMDILKKQIENGVEPKQTEDEE